MDKKTIHPNIKGVICLLTNNFYWYIYIIYFFKKYVNKIGSFKQTLN